MRKLRQPEIKKATSKARNTSKSVLNTWVNERKILKARQVPVVPVQQTHRAACPSVHTCFAWGRGSLGRSPVWTRAIMLGQTSRPSRALAHMTAGMAIISKEVLSLLHMPRREAHISVLQRWPVHWSPWVCAFSSFSRVSNVTHPRRASLLGSWQVLNSQLPSSLQITEASITSCISTFYTKFELVITDMSML